MDEHRETLVEKRGLEGRFLGGIGSLALYSRYLSGV